MLQRYSGGEITLKLGQLRLAASLKSKSYSIPPKRAGTTEPATSLAYVASRTVPLLYSGYTNRTHAILRALSASGLPPVCYARPGFPHDHSGLNLADWSDEPKLIDGVEYIYSAVEPITIDPESYVDRVSAVLEERFRSRRPSIVQAASNHRNALPALIAARRLGLPFAYEVRGLWELTSASSRDGWEATERFRLDRDMEVLVAREADHVFAITGGVADELAASGVERSRISLLPNAVDADLFRPMPKPQALLSRFSLTASDFILVYCGAILQYEGLDDLIKAVALLRMRGISARLIIVGRGSFQPDLERIAESLGLAQDVTFVEPVPQREVPDYWALADAVAIPRKAYRVCELVSPLKPFESMSMARPTVLSDLAALREIVRDDETGLLCRPSDPNDLAGVLQRLATDARLRERLGAAARKWVVEARSWKSNADRLKAVYGAICSGTPLAPAFLEALA